MGLIHSILAVLGMVGMGFVFIFGEPLVLALLEMCFSSPSPGTSYQDYRKARRGAPIADADYRVHKE